MEKEEEKLSMSARTEEAIVQLILDKNWQPGQQIPPEPELCTLLGASRNTLREAIRALVARNVLEIRRGNGTFVSGRMGVPDDPLGLAFVAHPGPPARRTDGHPPDDGAVHRHSGGGKGHG